MALMTFPADPTVSSLYSTPIQFRKVKGNWFRTVVVLVVFNIAILFVNVSQWVIWFLFGWWSGCKGVLYERGISWTKGCFGTLCVGMCQWFAPTSFVVTTEGMDESKVFLRDKETEEITGLDLPDKLVMMANHQVYLDWWYLWAFSYFMNAHHTILIILKKSLKWVPLLGWGMQFYRFIFLARSWEADRVGLGQHLTRVGKQAQKLDEPFTLMIFPEGTLVSTLTRPTSRQYAEKMGLRDLTNCILPRSTGLLFSLRTLSPFIPDLHLLDVTIGYTGVPPAGYGQSYYTIRSVFVEGIPPPQVHLHLRMYNVKRDLPIGDVSESDGIGRGAESTGVEKEVFDKWLRERWEEKDALLNGFYENGKFESTKERPVKSSAASGGVANGSTATVTGAVIPVRLWSDFEALNAFSFFVPVIAWNILSKTKAALLRT